MTATGRALHPSLTPEERRSLLARGIELFNRGAYFDAHEAWEEIWRSTTPEPRDLFQGLIQVAVGLHHFRENGRRAVAARLLGRGRRRLEPLGGTSHGLDLAALLESLRCWESWLRAGAGAPPPPPRVGSAAG